MKIIYSPYYDGEIFLGDKPEAFRHLYAGNVQLLQQLGLRAGIHVDPVSDMEREAAYQKAMEQPLKGTSFEHSATTDPIGVAAKLLLWRDNLIVAGWDGTCTDPSLSKLYLLAEIEKNFVKAYHGLADYWRTVCECYESPTPMSLPFEEVLADCPWSEIPTLVQRTLVALDKRGVNVRKTILDGNTFALDTQKIEVAQFDDLLEAYEWIAQLKKKPANCAIINRDNVRLNHTLYTWDKPAVHASLNNSNPQLLQLFKLCFCVFARPLNLENIIAYLQLPLSPIPGGLRHKLAKLLLKNGGFGEVKMQESGKKRDDWEEAVETFGFLNKDGKVTPQARAAKMPFITPVREDLGKDIPLQKVVDYVGNIHKWLGGFVEDNDLPEEIKQQIHEVSKMFAAFNLILQLDNRQKAVTYTDIERIVSRIYRPISYTQKQSEKNSLNVIRDIRSMAAPADTLVWLDCHAEDVEHDPYDFLSTAERQHLASHHVQIPDFATHLKTCHQERNRMLNNVTGKVLLVQSHYDGTKRLSEHSLIAEVKHLCGKNLKVVAAEHVLPKKKTVTQKESIDTYEPKLEYKLAVSAFKGRKESNSSLETLIQRPFNYVMQYVANLPMPEDEQVKSPENTFGLVAHHFFQHVIEEGKAMPGDVYDNMRQIVNKQYDKLLGNAIQAAGLILLQDENATKLHTFNWQLKGSIITLIDIMKHLALSPVGCEMEFPTGNTPLKLNTIGDFGARIDFLLTNPKNQYVIFDFKWSMSKRYVEKLEKNVSLQLELYKQAVKKSTGKKVKGVGYYMMPMKKLFTTDFPAWDDKIIQVATTSKALFTKIKNSYTFRKKELKSKKIEEAEMMDVAGYGYFDDIANKELLPLEVKDKSSIKKSEYVFKPSRKRSYEDANKEPYETPTSHPVLKGRLK